jgi:hypothetical protein
MGKSSIDWPSSAATTTADVPAFFVGVASTLSDPSDEPVPEIMLSGINLLDYDVFLLKH